jgi:predicted nucleic acid-binding protein
MQQQKLQLGETQAIGLGLAIKAEVLLLDEQRAVEFAKARRSARGGVLAA